MISFLSLHTSCFTCRPGADIFQATHGKPVVLISMLMDPAASHACLPLPCCLTSQPAACNSSQTSRALLCHRSFSNNSRSHNQYSHHGASQPDVLDCAASASRQAGMLSTAEAPLRLPCLPHKHDPSGAQRASR